MSECLAPDCAREKVSKGYCSMRYQRLRSNGSLERMTVDRGSYRKVTIRDRYGNKRCYYCDQFLPESQFIKDRRRLDGLAIICRKCRRNEHVKYRYGMTSEELDQMFELQGSACAICQDGLDRTTDWTVDHNHSCCPSEKSCGLCIRAILCRQCNCGIGLFKDDVGRLEKAIDYLRSFGV